MEPFGDIDAGYRIAIIFFRSPEGLSRFFRVVIGVSFES